MQELAADDSVIVRSRDMKSSEDLPPSYWENPIVQSHPSEDVIPLALYMDGLPYSHTDAVVGVWLINLVTGMRHMISIIRKRICCKCGCRSFCTFEALYKFINWSLVAFAAKTWPQERHDETPWQDRDSHRSESAGKALTVRGALIQIKGDWSEFCSRLGFPNWASNVRPCFLCASRPTDMFVVRGVSTDSLP